MIPTKWCSLPSADELGALSESSFFFQSNIFLLAEHVDFQMLTQFLT